MSAEPGLPADIDPAALGEIGDTAALEALAASLAGAARPGEQLEVCISRGTRTVVKAYGGEVESLTIAGSAALGVRVVRDQRQGFASCGTLDPAVIAETLADARDNVGYGEPDEWFGVAEPDGVPAVPQDLWCDALVALPTDAKVPMALELERLVRAGDPRITGVRSATYADAIGESVVANSLGLAGSTRGTWCSVSALALAEAGDDTSTGGGHDVRRDPAELDLAHAADDAVTRATRLLGASKIPSRRMALVLEPRLAATILGIAGGTLTGGRLVKGRTPFAGRVGEQIATPLLTLVDDPTDARSFAADAVDGEGLACRRNPLIVDGVLAGFLHDSYTGRRTGTGSTGSAVRGARTTPGPGCQALAVVPGARSFDAIVADVDDALAVQSFTGLHSGVNAVSGDVSVGVEGLLVRDGTLGPPVREVTVASTLQKMLLDIREVGGDLEWLPGGTGAATLVIDDVVVSGT